MVCGFRPADRGNGERDETHTELRVAWLMTDTHTRWLLCYLTQVTEQTGNTHSVTFYTLPHTHLRKKTNYFENRIFVHLQWWLWNRIRKLNLWCHTSNNLHDYKTMASYFCSLSSNTGFHRINYNMYLCQCVKPDSSPECNRSQVVSFPFFSSHVFSHCLVLLPPQVVSAFIFTFVGVLAVMLWFLTVCERGRRQWVGMQYGVIYLLCILAVGRRFYAYGWTIHFKSAAEHPASYKWLLVLQCGLVSVCVGM